MWLHLDNAVNQTNPAAFLKCHHLLFEQHLPVLRQNRGNPTFLQTNWVKQDWKLCNSTQETFRNSQNLQLQRAGFVAVQAPYLGLFIALNIADLLL